MQSLQRFRKYINRSRKNTSWLDQILVRYVRLQWYEHTPNRHSRVHHPNITIYIKDLLSHSFNNVLLSCLFVDVVAFDTSYYHLVISTLLGWFEILCHTRLINTRWHLYARQIHEALLPNNTDMELTLAEAAFQKTWKKTLYRLNDLASYRSIIVLKMRTI